MRIKTIFILCFALLLFSGCANIKKSAVKDLKKQMEDLSKQLEGGLEGFMEEINN